MERNLLTAAIVIGFSLGVVIIIQLTIIIQKFSQLFLLSFHHKPDGQGHVINVNLDGKSLQKEVQKKAGGAVDGLRVPLPAGVADIEADTDTEEAEVKREKPKAPAKMEEKEEEIPAGVHQTVSGLSVALCPKCGNENSSFRRECYHCNARL